MDPTPPVSESVDDEEMDEEETVEPTDPWISPDYRLISLSNTH